MLEVVAAILKRDDRILICQRPAHKARALQWEFPGGKVESGETREEALIRECREELDICLKPESIFTEVTHQYPDLTVHLTFFLCSLPSGEPRALEHHQIRWATPEEFSSVDFCPADKGVADLICRKTGKK
ncbi:MAG: (deoxy)nucleoside triphosphate pyrophosphohydrolase [Clostridiales bacterium]|nr:(deoxy)nucleoside triphosphate pyrophosphohydrolase [Clostridiales bacterium]